MFEQILVDKFKEFSISTAFPDHSRFASIKTRLTSLLYSLTEEMLLDY